MGTVRLRATPLDYQNQLLHPAAWRRQSGLSALHSPFATDCLLARFTAGRLEAMADITRALKAIEQGDPHAAEQLLPLLYDELRQLAAAKLAQEKPGQTLQATAL